MFDITFRPGTLADSYTVYTIFRQSILDLGQRLGVMAITGGDNPDVLAQLWEDRRPLFEHLAGTAEHFWLAEKDGQPIGYARTIVRDGVRELTEFFVLPQHQLAGIGRKLLGRVFPADDIKRRVIIATPDTRSLARYLKVGVYPRFPTFYLSRSAEKVAVASDLRPEPIALSPENLARLRAIDLTVLGHQRDIDHTWLLEVQQGYLYYRGRETVGYGYLGQSQGPFALLNEADFPAVLAHAETEAAAQGDVFGVEVPMINRAAVDYLLGRGCQLDSFFAFFMSDALFGKFENYIFPSPPFFM
ncbi:MAG: GNAT family N-acetyltransferase [Anaerolineae bacterium]